jgi:hypothetical protein
LPCRRSDKSTISDILKEYDRLALVEEAIIPCIDRLLEGEGTVKAFEVDIDQEPATIALDSL